MPGTVLAVGVIGASAVLAVALGAAGAAAVCSQRAAAAADGAALAAADAASGAVPLDGSGTACGRARAVASASGAELASCAVDDLVATVSVRVPFGPLAAVASARAGPPGAR